MRLQLNPTDVSKSLYIILDNWTFIRLLSFYILIFFIILIITVNHYHIVFLLFYLYYSHLSKIYIVLVCEILKYYPLTSFNRTWLFLIVINFVNLWNWNPEIKCFSVDKNWAYCFLLYICLLLNYLMLLID